MLTLSRRAFWFFATLYWGVGVVTGIFVGYFVLAARG